MIRASLFALGVLATVPFSSSQAVTPPELDGVELTERLGATLPGDIELRTAEDETILTAELFDGDRPVLLVLGYSSCPMLCGLVLNAATVAVEGADLALGDDYRFVWLSIDHEESVAGLAAKKKTLVERLGVDPGSDAIELLLGDERAVAAVAEAIGFGYRYDRRREQYVHPAVIQTLSPEGKVARYLYGIEYPSNDLRFALLEAAEGRVGSTVDRVLINCFAYDPAKGGYTVQALGVMRLGGAFTAVGLGCGLGLLWLRDRRRRPGELSDRELRGMEP